MPPFCSQRLSNSRTCPWKRRCSRGRRRRRAAVDAIGSAMDADVIPVSYDPANLGGSGTFVRLHSGDDRSRLRDVVLASRDAFTTRRNWTVRNERSLEQHRIQRRGSTTLSDLDTWDANDSMVHRSRRRTARGWREQRRLIGEGTADTADSPSSESVWLARTYDFQPLYSGLPSVHDLREQSTDPARTRYGVSVHVVKRRADTLTSQHAAQAGPSGRSFRLRCNGGAHDHGGTGPGRGRVRSTAPSRPPYEYANLFSPFGRCGSSRQPPRTARLLLHDRATSHCRHLEDMRHTSFSFVLLVLAGAAQNNRAAETAFVPPEVPSGGAEAIGLRSSSKETPPTWNMPLSPRAANRPGGFVRRWHRATLCEHGTHRRDGQDSQRGRPDGGAVVHLGGDEAADAGRSLRSMPGGSAHVSFVDDRPFRRPAHTFDPLRLRHPQVEHV